MGLINPSGASDSRTCNSFASNEGGIALIQKPNGHFTIVIWNDAHASLDESTVDEIKSEHKPSRIHTQGYMIVDDENGISIAGEWLPGNRTSDDDSYRSVTFIPRGMIVEVIHIKKPVTRKKKVGAVTVSVPVAAPISVEGESGTG